MHTATQLDVSKFQVQVDAGSSTCSALVPGWHRYDRFGIVVHESFGAVGASLLIQAVVAEGFRARREVGLPDIYPDIYAFHVGRDHGDLSSYDFWPWHKEVVVENDPAKVLQAINDRGITRLAVPDGEPSQTAFIWPELRAGEDRLETVLAYSPDGRTADADVEIRSLSPDIEWNIDKTFDLPAFALTFTGDDVDEDVRRWIGHVWARQYAVPDDERERVRRRQAETRVDGLTVETYRRADVPFALSRLAQG